MKFIEEKRDLFTTDKIYSLCHCVSKDFRMGKGIAKIFRDKYQHVDELRALNKNVGDVAIIKHGNRYIFYLITKERVHDYPTYQSMEMTLKRLKHYIRKYNITHLAMPLIGSGLDKLEWEKVKQIIINTFSDIDDLTILVCKL